MGTITYGTTAYQERCEGERKGRGLIMVTAVVAVVENVVVTAKNSLRGSG